MNLHDSPEPFDELVNASAQHLGIPAVYVEKDYWVTVALKRLSESDLDDSIVFKGGTALSKAHQIIERFSEDIDLAARADGFNGSQKKSLIKKAEKILAQDLTYEKGHVLESKGSAFRKTAHAFPIQSDASQLGQVANIVLLEINAFANPEPAKRMRIGTLIADFLRSTDRQDIIDQYQLESFEVLVLSVERTLCEKMMGLVRAGYENDASADFSRRIRHFYDIAMILRQDRYQNFVASPSFGAMVRAVKDSDRQTIPDAAKWLDPRLSDAPLFANTERLWNEIRAEYHGTFKDMIYGDSMPGDKEILAAVSALHSAVLRLDNDSTRL